VPFSNAAWYRSILPLVCVDLSGEGVAFGVSVGVRVEERGLGCGDGFGEDGFGVGVEVVEGL
jgi:hypothetical protein